MQMAMVFVTKQKWTGCTDELAACNYNDAATDDDSSSCDYCCAAAASVEGYNIIIETVGDSPEGAMSSACTLKHRMQRTSYLLLLVMH